MHINLFFCSILFFHVYYLFALYFMCIDCFLCVFTFLNKLLSMNLTIQSEFIRFESEFIMFRETNKLPSMNLSRNFVMISKFNTWDDCRINRLNLCKKVGRVEEKMRRRKK